MMDTILPLSETVYTQALSVFDSPTFDFSDCILARCVAHCVGHSMPLVTINLQLYSVRHTLPFTATT